MKQKVYQTGSISTLQEMNTFFSLIRGLFPEIDSFISTHEHELVNERICFNECYTVLFGEMETIVYLKETQI